MISSLKNAFFEEFTQSRVSVGTLTEKKKDQKTWLENEKILVTSIFSFSPPCFPIIQDINSGFQSWKEVVSIYGFIGLGFFCHSSFRPLLQNQKHSGKRKNTDSDQVLLLF